MVVLRLTRTGKKKQAFYRIVAADSRRFVNSKFIEILGWYNPKTKEISLKGDKVADWLSKGAQPSNTLAQLLKDNGVKLPEWVTITEKNRKPKKEPVVKEVKAAPVAEAPIEEVQEASAEVVEEVIEETPAEETAAEVPAAEVVEEPSAEETPAKEEVSKEAPTE